MLVAHGEPHSLGAISRSLGEAGFAVSQVSTARDAFDQARQNHPVLILLSIALPDEDGIALCRRIKAEPALCGCMVALLSDLSTDEEAASAFEAGTDEYIAFPLSEGELLAHVRGMVRARQLQDELHQRVQHLEALLRESRERFRTVLEGSVEGILVHRNTRPLFANPAYARIFGYDSVDQVLALDSVVPLIAPYDRQRLLGYHAARTRGDPAPNQYEAGAVRRDGSIITLHQMVTVISWDGQPAVLSAFIDVTERKQAEAQREAALEALRQSEARFKAQYEGIPIPTYTWQKKGDDFVLVDQNSAATAFAQGGIQTQAGAKASELFRDRPDIVEDLWQCLTEKRPCQREMTYELKSTGEVKHLAVKHAYVPPDLVMVHIEDITERRVAVHKLGQHARDLEARNQELDAYAHTVAHDLKDPLALVTGFAEVLREDHATMSEAEIERLLLLISHTGSRMHSILEELLLLAEVRMADVETEPLDMGKLVASAEGRLAQVIEQAQAEIAYPAEWPQAMGYGPWIEEVWVNYVSNAIKYGGRPPRVELGATVQGANVRFWVRDNGPGIAPEDQAILFTPFTRLNQVRARGHGLGLSVVRRIIDKLGAQAGVENTGVPGEGSVFYFVLPLWDPGG
ncbi:MAG TPA: PAS domain S-box protein [Anaerolineae bacterium]|nr:PAS domain S-box protein [Anaerolineae bacterium]